MEWATTTKWPAYGHIAIAAGEVDTYVVGYGPATGREVLPKQTKSDI